VSAINYSQQSIGYIRSGIFSQIYLIRQIKDILDMYKLTLVLFASLIFFTTASYAENEELVAQVTKMQSKLKTLHESNNDLKNMLASRENEIEGWRLALENIEMEIAGLEEE